MVTTDRAAVEVAVAQLQFQIKAYSNWLYQACADIDEALAMSALVESLKSAVATLEASL